MPGTGSSPPEASQHDTRWLAALLWQLDSSHSSWRSMALPAAFLGSDPLQTAILGGPLSLVGAPFNLNPPSQTEPLESWFPRVTPNLKAVAQGTMMIGVMSSPIVAGILGPLFLCWAGEEPPRRSPAKAHTEMLLGELSAAIATLTALILLIIASAFALQRLLLGVPGMKEDFAPTILLAFLLGASVRLACGGVFRGCSFPEQALTVMLLGPTMSLVLSYAVMNVPLHELQHVTPRLWACALLGIGGSVGMAILAYGVLVRFTNAYYAAVIATVFLAVTTGWGPVGMTFLHRFIDQQGDVEPMPVLLPFNAFYLFPWMTTLLTMLVLRLGS